MKNKFYHISTYSVMRYWTILWMAVLSFSCSDFNPMDSYSRIPPDRNTDIDDGDEGDGAGGLFEKGYGTMNKPYLVMDVIQIQNMSEALEVAEAPGFVVNKILIPMINEAIGLVETGVASVEDIDKAMMLGANHPRAPSPSATLSASTSASPS